MNEALDPILMLVIPAVLTIAFSLWLTLLLRKRRWHWIVVFLGAVVGTLLFVGFCYYGAIWTFRFGPANTDPNGFNIGAAMFLYGFFLPLSALVSMSTMLVRRMLTR